MTARAACSWCPDNAKKPASVEASDGRDRTNTLYACPGHSWNLLLQAMAGGRFVEQVSVTVRRD